MPVDMYAFFPLAFMGSDPSVVLVGLSPLPGRYSSQSGHVGTPPGAWAGGPSHLGPPPRVGHGVVGPWPDDPPPARHFRRWLWDKFWPRNVRTKLCVPMLLIPHVTTHMPRKMSFLWLFCPVWLFDGLLCFMRSQSSFDKECYVMMWCRSFSDPPPPCWTRAVQPIWDPPPGMGG